MLSETLELSISLQLSGNYNKIRMEIIINGNIVAAALVEFPLELFPRLMAQLRIRTVQAMAEVLGYRQAAVSDSSCFVAL